MSFPLFFEETFIGIPPFILSEESSKHIVQVLRMKERESIMITNGKGRLLTAEILSANKKKAEITITKEEFISSPKNKIAIAVSLIKNTHRFEWLVEKATEIGVSTIIPLICKRTEKSHFRSERIKSILISAMLQSRQSWLPELSLPMKLDEVITSKDYQQKFIAHCIADEKKELNAIVDKNTSRIILIGPEGDFTEEEVRDAIQQSFVPVTLGDTRLRTETAGLVAAVLLK